MLKLISSQQTPYVKGSGRLICSINEISDLLNSEGFLVTMDVEKAFDSLGHDFLISVLREFESGKYFIT